MLPPWSRLPARDPCEGCRRQQDRCPVPSGLSLSLGYTSAAAGSERGRAAAIQPPPAEVVQAVLTGWLSAGDCSCHGRRLGCPPRAHGELPRCLAALSAAAPAASPRRLRLRPAG